MIYPDLGTAIQSLGVDRISMTFMEVPITRLSLVRLELFTTTVNLVYEGAEHAASFDFHVGTIVEISRRDDNPHGDMVLRELAALRPGESFDLPAVWHASLRARLSDPESGTNESFVPLLIEAVW